MKNYIKILIAAAALFLIIITFFLPLGIYIFNFGFYDSLYLENGVYEELNEKDVKTMTFMVFRFFQYRDNLDGQVKYAEPTRSMVAFFNDNEISHMVDVRELLKNIFILILVSLISFIILVLLIMLKDRKQSLKKTGLIFLWSSSFTLLIFLVLLILSTNFYSLFDNFHVVFFPQGNYMFPEGSLLLMMFPFGFFFQFFIRLAISSSVIAAFLFILGIVFTVIGYKKGK